MTALARRPFGPGAPGAGGSFVQGQEAPRALILALAADEPEAAAAVLQHSPVLTDADLVDCVATGDLAAQTALARRPILPPAQSPRWPRPDSSTQFWRSSAISRSIFRPNCWDAFSTASATTRAFAKRCSSARGCRRALRARIAVAAAKDLAVEASQWMSPDRELSASPARRAIRRSARSLRHAVSTSERSLRARCAAAGALTPALLLRSLLGGERDLFVAAMAELSGLPPPRVAAFVVEPHGEGFAALARRAGLKNGLLPAFRAALATIKTHGEGIGTGSDFRSCKRLSTIASGAKIPRSPRFSRCSGVSPPKRRRRKPRASRARRRPRLRAVGCRRYWTFLPSNDDAGDAPMLTGPAPFNLSAPLDDAA